MMWETHTNPMISLKFIENGVYHKLNVSIENLRNGDGTTIPSAKTEFTDSVSDVPASNIYTDKIWYRVIKYEKKKLENKRHQRHSYPLQNLNYDGNPRPNCKVHHFHLQSI